MTHTNESPKYPGRFMALFDRACWWRDRTLEALNKSNIRHQVVFSSESVTGITAAISAGVAVGVVGERSLCNEFKILTLKDGFPSMPDSALILECREGINNSISQAMSYAIREAFGKV